MLRCRMAAAAVTRDDIDVFRICHYIHLSRATHTYTVYEITRLVCVCDIYRIPVHTMIYKYTGICTASGCENRSCDVAEGVVGRTVGTAAHRLL